MLRIAKLVTDCRVPSGREDFRALAGSIASEQLAPELAARLGPSLSRSNEIVKIRRLTIHVAVRGRTIDRRRLIDAWVRAICRHLFTALSYPEGGGQYEIERWPNHAAFRAALIRDLLSGAFSGKWVYRSHQKLSAMARSEAIMTVLREDPRQMIESLQECERAGILHGALAVLDELGLEELFRAIASSLVSQVAGASVEHLPIVAAALRKHSATRTPRFDDRRQALRLFLLSYRDDVELTPRIWLHASTALVLLSEHGELWLDSSRSVEQICGRRVAPGVEALIDNVRKSEAARLVAAQALEAAALSRPKLVQEGIWIDLDRASLLLLIRPLLSMPWIHPWRDKPLELQALLYGLALEIHGILDPLLPRLDPTAAAFAGIFGDAALTPMRRFFASPDHVTLVRGYASELIARFTASLPGFRKAERPAIVRQFLSTRGRIRVGPDQILAVLDPNPTFVALRIAGLDDPIAAVPWFENRRIEFRIEGL